MNGHWFTTGEEGLESSKQTGCWIAKEERLCFHFRPAFAVELRLRLGQVDTLQGLSENGDSSAQGFHSSVLKWDFLITNVILQHIF